MMRLHQLAQLVGGNLTSAADPVINGAASINRATNTQITFACSTKLHEQFLASDAAAAIIPKSIETSDKPCIRVENVEAAFAKIAGHFKPPIERPNNGISPHAIVSPIATIAEDACIHPGAVIMDGVQIGSGSVVFPNATVMENVCIGENVTIYPNVTLYENTVIGDRSIVHAGAVLGAFGFGYKSDSSKHLLSAQLGNVVLGEDVEIGANTTVDRGSYDSTTIGNGTKLDNLVMIGHNCMIGDHNLLCSQVGIAGSSKTGSFVVMAGQVGMADHLTVGDNVQVGAQSGLINNMESNQSIFGSPAKPMRDEMKILVSRIKLPEMRKSLRQLEKDVAKLTAEAEDKSESKTKAA